MIVVFHAGVHQRPLPDKRRLKRVSRLNATPQEMTKARKESGHDPASALENIGIPKPNVAAFIFHHSDKIYPATAVVSTTSLDSEHPCATNTVPHLNVGLPTWTP